MQHALLNWAFSLAGVPVALLPWLQAVSGGGCCAVLGAGAGAGAAAHGRRRQPPTIDPDVEPAVTQRPNYAAGKGGRRRTMGRRRAARDVTRGAERLEMTPAGLRPDNR